MEFDLVFNFAPILSIVLLVFVIIITVFQKLKLRWPMKVNCWFCNNDTKIWREQVSWWMCPYCEQYNGFSKNGDYAYDIPEQYKTSSNENKRYCTINKDTATNKVANNGLCKQCNKNENIKISKLSDYMPKNEKNFEFEIQKFKHSLEQQYPLCENCKTTVHNVLYKQALWLAQYKMLFFKKKPFTIIVKNKKYSEFLCRVISTILSSMVAYNMEFIYLPIGGLFFQLCAYCITQTRKEYSDTLPIFLWICMILLLPFKDIKLVQADLLKTLFCFEYITHYNMIMLFAIVIAIINIIPKSHKSTSSKNMSFKKVEPFAKNTVLFGSCAPSEKHNFSFKTTSNGSETVTNTLTPKTMKDCMPSYDKNLMGSKPTVFENSFRNEESQLSSMCVAHNKAVFNPASLCKKSIEGSHALNDSLNSLSILSLSDDKPKYSTNAPKMFERKVYSTKSSELFKKCGKKNILSPPKLKSVTQTSWVAGGYWQEGIDAPSLSRSSSQSSGFGSVGSNFGLSREPSIHEFDQCSVMSDATQSYYTIKHTNSPVGSFCQQSLQFPMSESRNQLNQTMKLKSPNVSSPETPLSLQNNKKDHSTVMDQISHGHNSNVNGIKSPSEIQMFPSQTTIVTSPAWLPALLCGSLVLNFIVLCTTLLR